MSKTKNNACLGLENVDAPLIIAMLDHKSIDFDGIASTFIQFTKLGEFWPREVLRFF